MHQQTRLFSLLEDRCVIRLINNVQIKSSDLHLRFPFRARSLSDIIKTTKEKAFRKSNFPPKKPKPTKFFGNFGLYMNDILLYHAVCREFFHYRRTWLVSPLQSTAVRYRAALRTQPDGELRQLV